MKYYVSGEFFHKTNILDQWMVIWISLNEREQMVGNLFTRIYRDHEIEAEDIDTLRNVIAKLFTKNKEFRNNEKQMKNATAIMDILDTTLDDGCSDLSKFREDVIEWIYNNKNYG